MLYSRRAFSKHALAGWPLALSMTTTATKAAAVRIGLQSFSFRALSLDDAVKAMQDIGIGECELFSAHIEPRPNFSRPPQSMRGGGTDPAFRAEMEKWQEEVRKWRLTASLDQFKAVRQKFDAARIRLQAYNLSFSDQFSDADIERGFQIAQALGVDLITASATLSAAKRVAPFANKYKITVAMHGHSNLTDPNEFAKPESFAAALAMSKYFAVNLDIGHFFAAGFDPIAYIEQNHKRISNIHLKDRKKNDGPNTPWGQGDTPIKAVLQLLQRKRYNIPANIEYEYQGADAIAEVRKCFQYCKDALA